MGGRREEYLSGVNGDGNRSRYPVPAVVLLDLNLPEVSGFEVLKWIRGHPDYAVTPVVVFFVHARGGPGESAGVGGK